jgi:hypothetical protein
MKRDHEAQCAKEMRNGSRQSPPADDLLAVGPDIVCVGEIIAVEESEWALHLKHFVVGDVGTLIAFIGSFTRSAHADRYVLVNAIGDGRMLTAAPSLAKSETGHVVRCQVASSFPRIMAQHLPTDLAL